MARRSAQGQLIVWAVLIGGSYIGYTKARTGDFGPSAKNLADGIHNTFGKLGLAWGGKSLGDGSAASGPGGSAASGPNDCPFVPGYRYVARYDDVFVVVWNGAEYLRYTSQSTAEEAYRRLCAGGA